MKNANYQAAEGCKKANGTQWERYDISLAVECRLSISVNGTKYESLLCSPDEPEELIIGFLLTEGIIADASQISGIELDESEMPESLFAAVTALPVFPDAENRGKSAAWDCEMIKKFSDFVIGDALRSRSGHSTHSCSLMHSGDILCTREDIGRHNSLDRAVGWAAERGVRLSECIAFFSGRISEKAVQKASAAGITVLCSKVLPTAQAVRLAAERGITLLHYSERRGILKF